MIGIVDVQIEAPNSWMMQYVFCIDKTAMEKWQKNISKNIILSYLFINSIIWTTYEVKEKKTFGQYQLKKFIHGIFSIISKCKKNF